MGRPGDFAREIAAAARRHFSWTRDRKPPSQPIRRPIPGKRSAPPNSPRKSPATPGRETPGRRRPRRATWPSARGAQPPHRRAPRRDPRNGSSGGRTVRRRRCRSATRANRRNGGPINRLLRPWRPLPCPRRTAWHPRRPRRTMAASSPPRPRCAGPPMTRKCGPATTPGGGRPRPSTRGAPRASATPSAKAATASQITNTSPGRSRTSSARAPSARPAAVNGATLTAGATAPTTARARAASPAARRASRSSASPRPTAASNVATARSSPYLSPGYTARHRAELAAAGAACVITEDRDWRFAKLGDKRLRADRRADPPASRLAAQQPWSCVPETRADTARGLSRLTSIHAGAPHGRQPGVRWV